MKHLFSRFIMSALILAGIIFFSFTLIGHVQAHTYQPLHVVRSTDSSGHVTIIILDMSGSMSTNDPQSVRCSAANAYIDLSGSGDMIGAVGLDGKGTSDTDPQSLVAQSWASPTPMDSKPERDALKKSIATQSRNCRPDLYTPTADALQKALDMLTSATQTGKSGSVILLTDGLPDPDSQNQLNTIRKLVPQFQQHNWPIDTIALGTGADFSFLQHQISDPTKGQFYRDTDGVIPGDSPLNIAPFFVQIFQLRNHRTVGPTIDPTTLNNETITHDFTVGPYVDHLDVIAVKDSAAVNVTLTAPDKKTTLSATSVVPGVFVSASDPHYAMFSIDKPQQGLWLMTMQGSGQVLMDSLIVSSLSVVITSPDEQHAVPLNLQFTINAELESHNVVTGDSGFTLQATIKRQGKVVYEVTLNKDPQTGQYTDPLASLTDPNPAGSYEIDVSASSVSGVPVTQDSRIVQFDHFPVPSFFSPTNTPTNRVQVTVVSWGMVLRTLYSVFPWLGSLPPQNLLTQPYPTVYGDVQLQGKPYPNATITAQVMLKGSQTPINAEVVNDGKGRFHIRFLSLVSGTYIVTFRTQGSFGGTNDFGSTTATIQLVVVPATILQKIEVWGIIVFYLLALIVLVLLIISPIRPQPAGKYTIDPTQVPFPLRNRNPIRRLLRPNLLYSRRTLQGAGPGLQILDNDDRQGTILVRSRGWGSKHWFTLDKKPVGTVFSKRNDVIYSPTGKPGAPGSKTYRFVQPEPPARAVQKNDGVKPLPGPGKPQKDKGWQPSNRNQKKGYPSRKNRI